MRIPFKMRLLSRRKLLKILMVQSFCIFMFYIVYSRYDTTISNNPISVEILSIQYPGKINYKPIEDEGRNSKKEIQADTLENMESKLSDLSSKKLFIYRSRKDNPKSITKSEDFHEELHGRITKIQYYNSTVNTEATEENLPNNPGIKMPANTETEQNTRTSYDTNVESTRGTGPKMLDSQRTEFEISATRLTDIRGTKGSTSDTNVTATETPDIRGTEARRPDTHGPVTEMSGSRGTEGSSPDALGTVTEMPGTRETEASSLDTLGTVTEMPGTRETEASSLDTLGTVTEMPGTRETEASSLDTLGTVTETPGTRETEASSLNTLGTVTERPGIRETKGGNPDTHGNNTQIPVDKRGLRAQLWYRICVGTFETLCDHPLFPKLPMKETHVTRLALSRNDTQYAQRIYGYLHPPLTGLYNFFVSSDDSSELWLSNGTNPSHARKICHVGEHNESFQYSEPYDFYKFPSQKSKDIYLEQGKIYYIETIHMQDWLDDHVEVAWRLPGSQHVDIIDGNVTSLSNKTRESPACVNRHYHHIKPSNTIHQSRYIDHDRLKEALRECKYRPNYLAQPGSSRRIPAWYFLTRHYVTISSYPYITYQDVRDIRKEKYKSIPLDLSEARMIVNLYMEQVEKAYPETYKVNNIINVEKKPDLPKGSRFLVELNVTLLNNNNNNNNSLEKIHNNNNSHNYEYHSNSSSNNDNKNESSNNDKINSNNSNKSFILSEYIYQNGNTTDLCYPANFQWTRQAQIVIIIPVRNQGPWAKHFLDNLQEIYVTTGERNVSLIIFDFESDDIDWKKELDDRVLPPYTLLQKPGVFSRSIALNAAIKAVKDLHSILLVLDLHMEVPWTIFDDVRKHCVEGRSLYTPIVLRLRCANTPLRPVGYWEQQGYGIVALYKSDWDSYGGLDEQKYKDKWGGEDWDIVEGVVMGGGLEYERLKHFTLFHFQHSRRGMWTGDKDIAANQYSN